jgi:hypothetical protein
MIRQSVSGNSAYAVMFLTGGGAGTAGGCNFQWRDTAGASAAPDGQNGPGITAPYWVRLERAGNTFTAFISPDGATWTQQGPAHDVVMTDPVLIGLGYTSRVDAATFGTPKSTNVVPTGNVDPKSANNVDVGLGNTAQPLYVAVQDAAGKLAVATYPEPAATTMTSSNGTAIWYSWKVLLSDLAGVDFKNVAKLFVGVGDSLNPKPDGVGVINVRNVRVVKPVSLPAVITSVVRANGQSGTRTDGSPINGKYDGNTTPVAMPAGGLKDGNFVFSDRNYPWSKIPAELAGSEYVLMFNSDKNSGETDVTYTVTFSRAATVWVTADDRIPAEWAAIGTQQAAVDRVVAAFAAPGTFTDTGLTVCIHENATTDRPMSVYAAELPAGTYVFDSQDSTKNFYTIGAIGGPVDITDPYDNVLGLPNNFNWPAAEFPRNAIDNSTGTKFLDFSGATEPSGICVTPFVGPTVVTGVRFCSANDTATYKGRAPVTYELSGSNDGIQGPWTLIAAGDIVDFAGPTPWPNLTWTTTPMEFVNTVAYKHYKLMFPKIWNALYGTTDNCMQIAEVELIGVLAK